MARHKFSIADGAALSAVSNDAALAARLEAVKEGGAAVHDWVATDMSALNELYKAIVSAGDAGWIDGTDRQTGLPTYTAVVGASSLTVGVHVSDAGRSALREGCDAARTYGFAYLTLVTGARTAQEATIQVATNLLQYSGPGVPGIDVGDTLEKLIGKIAGKVKSYVEKIIEYATEAGESATPAAAAHAARTKAGEAAEEEAGETTIELSGEETIEAEITFAEAAGLVLALGELVVSIVLQLLRKQMLSYLRFYNLGDVEVEFSLCHMTPDTALASGAMLPGTPVYVPGGTPAWTPPWIIGKAPVHYVNLVLGNTDGLKGLGYVVKARPNGDFPGFNVAIRVPADSDNTFGLALGIQDDCKGFWDAQSASKRGLAGEIVKDGWRLRVVTNQVGGRSPSPLDGAEGYFYEHAILLSRK